MNVYCLILLVLHSSLSVPIQMTGELDIQLIQNEVGVEFRGNKKKADSLVSQSDQEKNATTTTPGCLYQYPKRKQVDALLSNMMNELTKISVRVREYLVSENAKASRGAVLAPAGETAPAEGGTEGAGDAKESEKMRARPPLVRAPSSRFKIVSGKPQRFFDEVYSNMTQDYKNFYHERSGSVLLRSGPDPCDHQQAIRQLWLDLLDSSQDTLRRASLRCVRHYLRSGGPRSNDAKVKNKVGIFLLKEFKKLRSLQMNTLCDQFKLCYQGLL